MAEAVLDLFPGAKLGIGPAIDDGFYYDFDLPAAAHARRPRGDRGADGGPASRPTIRSSGARSRFDEARALRGGRGPGVQGRDPRRPRGAGRRRPARPPPVTSFYEHGPFSDLCKGPHVASTGRIGPFKLLSVAGAYWRGDEKRPMLQRIYGTVWETQEELDQFLWRREEAKKRDHRRLGVQLDLFSFHDVSPGAAFWHPKGWRLYRTLRDAMRELQDAARLRRDLHAAARPPEALGAVGPLGALPRQHVPRRGRGADLQPQADELPGVVLHLPEPAALVPRPAAAAGRVRRAPPQRALGRPLRA